MSEARQIQSMIDFIEREAQEKAEEVDAAAQEEYDIEKMRLIEAEKVKIRAALEKKKKQVDIDRRVARANYSKSQRLRIMDARARTMDALHERTHRRLMALVADQPAYAQLLRTLIQQSLLAVRTDALVQCRQEDAAQVQQMLPALEQWYKETTSETISVRVAAGEYLDTQAVWGGVVTSSSDGRIVCNNTLAYRAKTCFDEQLPAIRYYLFNPEATL